MGREGREALPGRVGRPGEAMLSGRGTTVGRAARERGVGPRRTPGGRQVIQCCVAGRERSMRTLWGGPGGLGQAGREGRAPAGKHGGPHGMACCCGKGRAPAAADAAAVRAPARRRRGCSKACVWRRSRGRSRRWLGHRRTSPQRVPLPHAKTGGHCPPAQAARSPARPPRHRRRAKANGGWGRHARSWGRRARGRRGPAGAAGAAGPPPAPRPAQAQYRLFSMTGGMGLISVPSSCSILYLRGGRAGGAEGAR